MSEFKRNIVSNFKRYTDGRNRVEYIVKIAMYTALAFVLYVVNVPLPFMFPSFLEIQISELPALIAGFSMGPISGSLVIILKCLLKFPMTGTAFVGELTDMFLGICFVVPSSLIYNGRKNKKTALFGLVVGSVLVTAMSLIVNRFISVPFYVNNMFGGSWELLLNMVGTIYKSVTKENFFGWYLGAGVLPFNILRCFIVSAVTYFLYPRIKRPLKLETMEVYNDKYSPEEKKNEISTENAVDTVEKDGVFVADERNIDANNVENNDKDIENADKDLANDDKK